MLAPARRGRVAGIAAGCVADMLFGDPRRGHPVALFGSCAAALETLTYDDTRRDGLLHTGALLGALTALGVVAQRAAVRRGVTADVVVTAAATFVALGGTSLARTGDRMAELLGAGEVDAARRLLPSLCGRDPSALDEAGLTRASVESVAENTSDAQVAPLLWAFRWRRARGTRLSRCQHARRDDREPLAAICAIRLGSSAIRRCRQLRGRTGHRGAGCGVRAGGGRITFGAVRAWRRDAARHPSPNAGVVEAAFAGALGVRLGGPTQYAHQLEIRPTLGDGPPPEISDLARAVRLSRVVQVVAAGIAVGLSAAGRSGRRVSPPS